MNTSTKYASMTNEELVRTAKLEVSSAIRSQTPVNGKVTPYCVPNALILELANRLTPEAKS